MPVSTQACRERPISRRAAALVGILLPMLAVLPLAGCTSGGVALTEGKADASVQTGEVAGAAKPEPDQLSDQATIRNAVSSADISGLGGQPLAWANSDTGSRGAITALNEQRQNGQLCRKFTTSRESFEGVALYQGEACMEQAGVWQLLDFKPL